MAKKHNNRIKQRADFKGNWLSSKAEAIASGDRKRRNSTDITMLGDTNYSQLAVANRRKDYKELYDLYKYYFGQPLEHNILSKSTYHPSNAKDNLDNYIAINDSNFINQVLNIANNEDLKLGDTKSVSGYAKVKQPANAGNFSLPAPSEDLVGKAFKRKRPNGQVIEGTYGLTMEQRRSQFNESYATNAIGNFRVGRGSDDKGEYISYYDVFDIGRGDKKVRTFGSAKPFEIYDRIYIDKDDTGKYIPKVNETNQTDQSNFEQGGTIDMAKKKVKMRRNKVVDRRTRTMTDEERNRLITGTPPIPSLPAARAGKAITGLKKAGRAVRDYYTKPTTVPQNTTLLKDLDMMRRMVRIPTTVGAGIVGADILSNDIGVIHRDSTGLSLEPRYKDTEEGEYELGGTIDKLPRVSAKMPKQPKPTLVDTRNRIYDKNATFNFRGDTYFEEAERLDAIKRNIGDRTTLNNRGKYNVDQIPNMKEDLYRHQIKNDKGGDYMLGGIMAGVNTAMSIYNAAEAKQQANNAATLQQELGDKQQFDTDKMFLENFDTSGTNTGYYEKGGAFRLNRRIVGNKSKFKPISKDVFEVKGAKHKDRGVKLGNNEVEGGELIRITPSGVKVLSDSKKHFGFSPAKSVKKMLNLPGGSVAGKFERNFALQEDLKAKGAVSTVSTGKFEDGGTLGLNDMLKYRPDYLNAMNVKAPTGSLMDTYGSTANKMDVGFGTPIHTGNLESNPSAFNLTKSTTPAGNYEPYGGKYSMLPYALDNIGNVITTGMTPKVQPPTLTPNVRLNKDVNVDPLIDTVTSTRQNLTGQVDRNISDENVATALKMRIGNTASQQINKIRMDEINKEAELGNREATANIYPNLARTRDINQYKTDATMRNVGVLSSTNKNIANIGDDLVDLSDKRRFDNRDRDRLSLQLVQDTEGSLNYAIENTNTFDHLIMSPTFKYNSMGLNPKLVRAIAKKRAAAGIS